MHCTNKIGFILLTELILVRILLAGSDVILYKSQLESYKINSKQPLFKLAFDPETQFDRLNTYLKRLLDVNKIIAAANGFMKLGKIEMGGIKSRQRISCAQSEFHALCTHCIALQIVRIYWIKRMS